MTRESEPFCFPDEYNVRITSANSNFQVARAPWPDPVNKYFVLKTVHVTNLDGAATAVHLWDQDLSNTTPATAGSAGTALVVLEGAASAASGVAGATTRYENLPPRKFFAGIAAQASRINVHIAVEVDVC